MSGWPLKSQARIVGIDDGPYRRGSTRTPVVMTLMRLDSYIEGVHITDVSTDGDDSSIKIVRGMKESGFLYQTRAILSDGACLAGFNVLDIDDLHERTEIPVITCSDSAPDPDSMQRALRENLPDPERRFSLVTSHPPHCIDLPDGTCYIRSSGISIERAEWVVRKSTVRGRTPEPIRISHMIARSITGVWTQ